MFKIEKLEVRQILSPILPSLKLVDKYILEFISSDLKILDLSAKQVFLKPGKKIRASLVLLGALLGKNWESSNKSKKMDEAVSLASSVELVHAATLIHDDIIDNAGVRRGYETVSKKWDSKIAVLVGDWMFTRGLDIAAGEKNGEILPVLIQATREMVKGELAQVEYSNIEKIDYDKYIYIISAKTAKFLGACIQVGAMSQWLDDSLAKKLYQFGYYSGLGFQIIDDSMDFLDKKVTGKDSANDYMEGKPTLPVILLLKAKPELKKEIFFLYKERSNENFEKLKNYINENNILEGVLNQAREFVDHGNEKLSVFGKNDTIDILKQLARFFINRSF